MAYDNRNIDDPTKLARMVESLLLSTGHVQEAGYYAYGRTSKGAPFIVLYPAAEYLKLKICRVYPHDFYKLAGMADTDRIPENAPQQPGDKNAVDLRQLPMILTVTTYDDHSKSSNFGPEKRFAHVLDARPWPNAQPQHGGRAERAPQHGARYVIGGKAFKHGQMITVQGARQAIQVKLVGYDEEHDMIEFQHEGDTYQVFASKIVTGARA